MSIHPDDRPRRTAARCQCDRHRAGPGLGSRPTILIVGGWMTKNWRMELKHDTGHTFHAHSSLPAVLPLARDNETETESVSDQGLSHLVPQAPLRRRPCSVSAAALAFASVAAQALSHWPASRSPALGRGCSSRCTPSRKPCATATRCGLASRYGPASCCVRDAAASRCGPASRCAPVAGCPVLCVRSSPPPGRASLPWLPRAPASGAG